MNKGRRNGGIKRRRYKWTREKGMEDIERLGAMKVQGKGEEGEIDRQCQEMMGEGKVIGKEYRNEHRGKG